MKTAPAPLGSGESRLPRSARRRVAIAVAVAAGTVCVGVAVLMELGLVRTLSYPSGAMTPTLLPGDHVFMEGLTFLWREPARGEVVIFLTDGLPIVSPGRLFVQRVAALPGDRLRVAERGIYVNDNALKLRTTATSDLPRMPEAMFLAWSNATIRVPDEHYFVIGDNWENSLDGRYWGFLPRENIVGRVAFRVWPPRRIGPVR